MATSRSRCYNAPVAPIWSRFYHNVMFQKCTKPNVEQATRVTASAFLTALIATVPYKFSAVLTDNGIQFRFAPRYADGPTARSLTHMYDMRCRENGIEHHFTKINHPLTNGQVERMSQTIKEVTVQRYH